MLMCEECEESNSETDQEYGSDVEMKTVTVNFKLLFLLICVALYIKMIINLFYIYLHFQLQLFGNKLK